MKALDRQYDLVARLQLVVDRAITDLPGLSPLDVMAALELIKLREWRDVEEYQERSRILGENEDDDE